MKNHFSAVRTLILLAVIATLPSNAVACPFCLAPMQTWCEMLDESDVVCLAKLVSADDGGGIKAPFSIVQLTSVKKGKDQLHSEDGKTLRINQYIFGEPGSVVILLGSMQEPTDEKLVETFATDGDGNVLQKQQTIQKVSATEPVESKSKVLQWTTIEQTTDVAWTYMTEAPALDSKPTQRLSYFLSFLENADPVVAADAWGEFANSSYEDIAAIRNKFPRKKLRTWIARPDLSPERVGLYGMMLGLCGNADDARFLRQQILTSGPNEIRFGLEGLMGGLMLLQKLEGLEFIQQAWLPQAGDLNMVTIMKAMEFVWTYEPTLIEKDVLRAAMRQLLSSTSARELVIRDLSRWNDWTVVDRLLETYNACKTDDPSTCRAIVGFMMTCQKSKESTDEQKAAANDALVFIETDNPDLVKMARRFLR